MSAVHKEVCNRNDECGLIAHLHGVEPRSSTGGPSVCWCVMFPCHCHCLCWCQSLSMSVSVSLTVCVSVNVIVHVGVDVTVNVCVYVGVSVTVNVCASITHCLCQCQCNCPCRCHCLCQCHSLSVLGSLSMCHCHCPCVLTRQLVNWSPDLVHLEANWCDYEFRSWSCCAWKWTVTACLVLLTFHLLSMIVKAHLEVWLGGVGADWPCCLATDRSRTSGSGLGAYSTLWGP